MRLLFLIYIAILSVICRPWHLRRNWRRFRAILRREWRAGAGDSRLIRYVLPLAIVAVVVYAFLAHGRGVS
jgi:hypothetical protein